jgi:hypothetical protein
MSRKKNEKREKTRDELIEEMFRPDSTLGYDRDGLGIHLLICGAYRIAESQFRRAIWLNPFEVRFKAHLAWCLYKDGRIGEAGKWTAMARAGPPDRRNKARSKEGG